MLDSLANVVGSRCTNLPVHVTIYLHLSLEWVGLSTCTQMSDVCVNQTKYDSMFFKYWVHTFIQPTAYSYALKRVCLETFQWIQNIALHGMYSDCPPNLSYRVQNNYCVLYCILYDILYCILYDIFLLYFILYCVLYDILYYIVYYII